MTDFPLLLLFASVHVTVLSFLSSKKPRALTLLSQDFFTMGFYPLVARWHILLTNILFVQCQHGLELIRLANPHFLLAFQK